MATNLDTSPSSKVDDESDSEYWDATQDFQPEPHNKSGQSQRSKSVIEPPHPVPPPRIKRKLKKNKSDVTPKPSSNTVPNAPLSPIPNSSEFMEKGAHSPQLRDPFVTIKEEGLLMNPELLRNSEVTVTSETRLKPSGRAKEFQPSDIVILSDGDSADEESKLTEGPSPAAQSQRDQPGSSEDVLGVEDVMIRNLDTGEAVPLSCAEEFIPKGTDPISLHIRAINSQYTSHSQEDSPPTPMTEPTALNEEKRRKKKIKFLPRFRKHKSKSGHEDKPETVGSNNSDEELLTVEGSTIKPSQTKYRAANHHKGPYDFAEVRLKQELGGDQKHKETIWTMKFSICGRLLATGGQDKLVRVWVLKSAYTFFHDLQAKYARIGASADSLSSKSTSSSLASQDLSLEDESSRPVKDRPFCVYQGHNADVLDFTWSKNYFLLSSSVDKTVRLWHMSRSECLCCFQHSEVVTCITFHPRDDRYFLSGSLDGKLRLWSIPDKKVALWNEIEGVGPKLITACNFCSNGKLVVVGTYDGRCLFYDTGNLKYHTQIQVRSRHGKNAKGRKISGLDPLPGEEKLLVTSNDSRIRLYNLKDHSLVCKYKGCVNNTSQIKASFNHDAKFIISGSEDHCVYIWRTNGAAKNPSGRRDKNDYYECFTDHSAVVTAALFAPIPGLFANEGLREVGEVIVAADVHGGLKVYVCGAEL